jgi:ABC-2 type transport system permease protein
MVSALILFSGAYFPVSVLPGFLRHVSEALPVTWSLDVLRSALLSNEIDGLRLAGIWAAVAVLLPLALVLFRRALDRARRDGSLGHY